MYASMARKRKKVCSNIWKVKTTAKRPLSKCPKKQNTKKHLTPLSYSIVRQEDNLFQSCTYGSAEPSILTLYPHRQQRNIPHLGGRLPEDPPRQLINPNATYIQLLHWYLGEWSNKNNNKNKKNWRPKTIKLKPTLRLLRLPWGTLSAINLCFHMVQRIC